MPSLTNQTKLITLQYLADTPRLRAEKPYRIRGFDIKAEDGIELTNMEWESHNITIEDLRNKEDHPKFEECGFKWIDYKTRATPGYSEESIIAYCDEMIALLHLQIEAEQVICYDMRMRKNQGINTLVSGAHVDRQVPDNPIEAAHVDHSKEIGWLRIAHHLSPEEKKKFFDGTYRLRIFNIWKPINHIIDDMPLAICDPRSVQWSDLISADQVGPGFNAEVYYLKPQPYHLWYWMSRQTDEEPLLFLSWDSHPPSEQLNACPHAAFHDPKTLSTAPPRESVEARLIAFTKL